MCCITVAPRSNPLFDLLGGGCWFELVQIDKLGPGKKLLENARRFATSRDYHAARDAWTRVLDIAVGNEDFLLERAKCHKALGDTNGVLEDTTYVLGQRRRTHTHMGVMQVFVG
jgi:hypothetical protein